MARYFPDRGDVVWMNLDPQAGQEQRGWRPALILSPQNYNTASGLALCCPVSSRVKNYPFEVEVEAGEVRGVVLCDHLRSLDWRARKARFVARASADCLDEVLAKIESLLHR